MGNVQALRQLFTHSGHGSLIKSTDSNYRSIFIKETVFGLAVVVWQR